MLSEKQTETYFKQAVEELYKNDGYLFDPDHGLHEQTVSHRLAVYLERRFLKNKTFRTCNLSVDCEYNRNRDDCKKLYGPCMDCRESCRIKELKTPFVYDHRSYSAPVILSAAILMESPAVRILSSIKGAKIIRPTSSSSK